MSYSSDSDVQAINDCDLQAQPTIIDQQVLIETINYNTNSAGLLQYSPATTFSSGQPAPGTFIVDYRGLVNVIQIKTFPFYMPIYSLWNNTLIQYGGVINMGILEMTNNGWTSSQVQAGGVLNQYQYQFSYQVTQDGDRYLMTPIIDTVNCKNLINFSTGALTFTFNTRFASLLIPSPYIVCTLPYTATPTIATFTTASGNPHNFTNGNYIEVYSVISSTDNAMPTPNTDGTLQDIILATPYIISVTSPTTFTIPVQISGVDKEGNPYTLTVKIFNVSLSISIPLRFRQIEKLRATSNRIIAVST